MKLAEVRCEKRDGVLVPQDITCGADFLVVEQSTTLRGVEFVLFDNVPASGNVRIEIHSEDAALTRESLNPWPTKRPEGWGKGCWFEANVWGIGGMKPRKMILLHSAPFDDGQFHYCGFDPLTGSQTSVKSDLITGYGPRAEVG